MIDRRQAWLLAVVTEDGTPAGRPFYSLALFRAIDRRGLDVLAKAGLRVRTAPGRSRKPDRADVRL